MVNYNIYGLSTQGKSSMHNCDNIYINGVYMDSFIFNHYQKNISGSGDMALLIICGGITDNEISKELLSEAKRFCEVMGYTDPRTVIEEVSKIVMQLDAKYSSDRQRKLDVGIFAAGGGNAYAVCYGNAGIRIGKNGKYVPFCSGNAENSIGTGNIAYAKLKPTAEKLSGKNRVLLYTESVSMVIASSDISHCMNYSSVKECVDNIEAIAKNIYLQDPFSLICMDIESEPEERKSKPVKTDDSNKSGKSSKAVIAVICLIAALVVAAVAGIAIRMSGNNKSADAGLTGGMTVEEVQELAKQKWKELKAAHKDKYEKLKKNKTTCDEIKKTGPGAYEILSGYEFEKDKSPETLEKLVEEFIEVYDGNYIEKYDEFQKAEQEDTTLTRELDEIEKSLTAKYEEIFSLKSELDEKCVEAEAKAKEEAEAAKKAEAEAERKKKSTPKPTEKSGVKSGYVSSFSSGSSSNKGGGSSSKGSGSGSGSSSGSGSGNSSGIGFSGGAAHGAQ